MKSNRCSKGSRSASKALGTQNESSRRRENRVLRVSGSQLLRALRGGQAGNENAKKTLAWLDSYDLSTPQGVDGFLQEVIKRTWTGELGTRAAGALNGSLRILLEHLALPALERRIEELEKRELKS